MGDLNVHGVGASSISAVDVIAPFQIPTNNEIKITDWKTTLQNPGSHAIFTLEKSDTQSFAAYDELDRTVMTVPGTFVATMLAVEIAPGKWVRVRAAATVGGITSATIVGKTIKGGLQIP